MKIEIDNIYNMDCLDGMKNIPDGSSLPLPRMPMEPMQSDN